MKNSFFSQIGHYTVCFFKYLLYLFNLAVLAGLGVKTVNLWISTPFDFSDTLAAFPDEPEFINKAAAEKQLWGALTFETLLFVIGGFLCYELLIKQKTFRRGIIAPMVAVFLWTAGESAFLFLPATDKAHAINTCQAAKISWDTKNHKCRLMDLELKRFEKLKALKKATRNPAPSPTAKKAKPSAGKTAPVHQKKPIRKTTVKKQAIKHVASPNKPAALEAKPVAAPTQPTTGDNVVLSVK